jgi:hypothetical protein
VAPPMLRIPCTKIENSVIFAGLGFRNRNEPTCVFNQTVSMTIPAMAELQ